MIFLVMIIACILGVAVGLNAPIISYTYSSYLAIAIIAALDSVFGGVASVINKKFDMKIFISYPDLNSRKEILNYYINKCNYKFQTSLDRMALLTNSFSSSLSSLLIISFFFSSNFLISFSSSVK